MAQSFWRFTNDLGQPYLIGLFHGDKDGHLVVHCNSRVVLIDFNVHASKDYSFFIEEELCEIKVEKQADGFVYSCQINVEVDTPKNRWRKSRIEAEQHFNQRVWWMVGGAAAFIVALSFLLRNVIFPRN